MSESSSLSRAQSRLGLKIVPGSKDRTSLIPLIENVYPEGEMRNPAYLHWEYDLNPAGDAVIRIGEKEGQPVGQYAVIPMRYRIDNTLVRGSLSLNTLTHSDFRGKGIFMLLANDVFKECRAQNISFTLGFPNPYSYKGFLRHLEFNDIGELPLWIRPMNLSRLANSRGLQGHGLIQTLLRVGNPAWTLLTSVMDRVMKASQTPVQEVTSLDQSFDDFWNRVKGQYPVSLIRDRSYLEWRFLKHPTRKYSVLVSQNAQGLQGYLITRIMEVEGVSCGMLVDMLVEKTAEGRRTARALISVAIQQFRDKQVELSGCLMPRETPGASALWRAGYVPCPARWLPQKFPVILRWHGSETPPNAYDFRRWYLTMGDYDVA